jgi:hypothetical protein
MRGLSGACAGCADWLSILKGTEGRKASVYPFIALVNPSDVPPWHWPPPIKICRYSTLHIQAGTQALDAGDIMAVTAGLLQPCHVVPAARRAPQAPVGRSTAVHVPARSAVLRRSDSGASALHCRLVPVHCRLQQPQVQCSAAAAAGGQGFAGGAYTTSPYSLLSHINSLPRIPAGCVATAASGSPLCACSSAQIARPHAAVCASSTAVISASSRSFCVVADDSKPASVETPEPLGKTLYLGALFGGWYAFNILFNMWVPALSTWREHTCWHVALYPCVMCTIPSRRIPDDA